MWIWRLLPAAVASIAIALASSHAQPSIDKEQAPFTNLSGKELVQRLTDGKSRPRAFYELWRRAEPDNDDGFEDFAKEHYEPEIVVCPQGKSAPPIYVVLCGFLEKSGFMSADDYEIERQDELFRFAPGLPPSGTKHQQLIVAFTADGRLIAPFGGDNVLNGELKDINGDGLVDRVELVLSSVGDGLQSDFLIVSTVKEEAQPLFAVILNWGTDEWTFRTVFDCGDGTPAIEAGPRTVVGLKPKAVWKWDPTQNRYVGPSGKTGDHFRVVDAANIWKELNRFQSEKLEFPKDPDAIPENHGGAAKDVPTATPTSALDRYQYSSLKDVSDADLFRFMAHGKSEFEREYETKIHNQLPNDFWTMDSKSAAMALIDVNRTDGHRAAYQIAIDDRDMAEPPARCTIAFSESSARDYNAVDTHYFLHVDPDESYLAHARTSAGGEAFYSAVYDQSAFDFRLCSLRYKDARKIADAIWWLDRARSRLVRRGRDSRSTSSSGDGIGKLTLRVNGQPLFERYATLWSGYLSDRWDGDYNRESLLNFAAFLIAHALPARLGSEWSQFDGEHSHDLADERHSVPYYAEKEKKRLTDLAQHFLDWFTPRQENISFAIVANAVQLAGTFALESTAERLRKIEFALPPPGPKKRTYKEVAAEDKTLPDAFTITDHKKRKQIERQHAALEMEMHSIVYDLGIDGADHLREATALACRRVATANDVEKLHRWAISKSEGSQWAFQRLAQIDRKKYADAIETIIRRTDGKWAREFFDELTKIDPERAFAIARDLPTGKKDALSISTFLLLRDAEKMTNEKERVATIIQIMLDPKSGWEERGRAINLLVPIDAPLRYPDRQVDEALLKLFEPSRADDGINFSLEKSCLALARRGRTDLFDRIAKELESEKSEMIYSGVLSALTNLAAADPSRLNPRLLALLLPQLGQTKMNMSEILWAIWSTDLRELHLDLERLATHSVDEYEDQRANSFGGAVKRVAGPFHLARKIVSVWSESDPLTRARLLVAMAMADAYAFVGEPMPERLARMKASLARAGSELSTAEKRELASFFDRIDANPPVVDGATIDPETCRKITCLARESLRL